MSSKKRHRAAKAALTPSGVPAAAALTPAQAQLHDLRARIAQARARLADLSARFEAASAAYFQHLLPAHEAFTRARFALARALAAAWEGATHPRHLARPLQDAVAQLLDDATLLNLSPEEAAFLATWLPGSHAQAETHVPQPAAAEPQAQRHTRTHAQRKADAWAQAQAQARTRTLRTIYISLAKLLHPDTESDPDLRATKEEEMKRLGTAYAQQDLATLLQLEGTWLPTQLDKPTLLTGERLHTFRAVLEEQLAAVHGELEALQVDPFYRYLAPYLGGKGDTGLRKLRADARLALTGAGACTQAAQRLRDNPDTATLREILQLLGQD